MSATIRPGQTDDAPSIADIFVETWRDTYAGMLPDRVLVNMSTEAQAGYWQRLLSGRRAAELVRVAESPKDGLIGFGSGGPLRRSRSKEGEVYTLYVRPAWQGRSVGRLLLAGLLRGLRDRGCRQALVWVVAANPSRFFYEAVGATRAVEKVERLWGVEVPQIGYRWPDIDTALKGPLSGS